MTIDKAIHQALQENKYIALASEYVPNCEYSVKFYAEHPRERITIMRTDGSDSKLGWQPNAEDLMSDDWIVVD